MACARRRGGRRRALAATGLFAVACAEPTVDALVVWHEGEAPRFQIYDSGERRTLPYETVVEDSDPSKLQLTVLPGGHGFLVVPANDTMVWIDARDGGHAVVDYDARWGKLRPSHEVLASGVAVTRWNEALTGMVVLPTVRGSAGPIWFPHPDAFRRVDGSRVDFALHPALDAPILHAWPEQPSTPNTVVVYELRAGGRGAPGIVERDRAEIAWRRPIESSGSLIANKCRGGACVSPSGDTLVMMELLRTCEHPLPCPADDPACTPCDPPAPDCRVIRYRWNAPATGDQRITVTRLPDGCDDFDHDGLPETPSVPRNGAPELLAALSDGVVLLEDQRRIHRADLDAGTWESVPKLGTTAMSLFPARRGGAALLVADNLQVIRADEHGIRIHSAEQMACTDLDATVVSPSGEWVLTVCEHPNALGTDRSDRQPGTVVRISPFGLEHFDGISMRALAIDDGGNAMLYSYATGDDEQEPRGLFVLDAGGHLARVDSLEPTPLRLMDGSAPYYFTAQPRVE